MLVILSALFAIFLFLAVFVGTPVAVGKVVYDATKKPNPPQSEQSGEKAINPVMVKLREPEEPLKPDTSASHGTYSSIIKDSSINANNSMIETPQMKKRFEELQKRNSTQV